MYSQIRIAHKQNEKNPKNMNLKNTLITIAAIAIAVIGLAWWGAKSSINAPNSAVHPTLEQSGTKSALSAPENFYDFGTISMAKGNVSHKFVVTNPTDKDVMVSDLVTSCMCTSAYIIDGNAKIGPFGMAGMGFLPKANMLVKAGETREIEAVYDPNAHGPAGIGPIDRFISLTDTNGGNLELEIKAVVTP